MLYIVLNSIQKELLFKTISILVLRSLHKTCKALQVAILYLVSSVLHREQAEAAALQCYTELMQAEKAVSSCITDNKSCRYSDLHESQTSGPL